MSVFKQKNSIASVEFKKFKGIDTRAPLGESGAAYDMVNFRVLPDGSLQKRCGFKAIASYNAKIRGVWSGTLGETTAIFAVYGSTVVKILPKEGRTTVIGKTSSSEGDVNFMFHNERLYLCDGQTFYIVTESNVAAAEGYVPLYGKDWPVRYKGEVNEPLNLASRHIRMTYIVTEELSFLCVDHVISEIDAVYINGELITDKSRYYFDEPAMCVSVKGLKLNDRVELFLTVSESETNIAEIFSCKNSVVYGDYADSILFLWNGNKKNIMFASSSVSEQSLEESRFMYPNSAPFYVPAGSTFKIPKENQQITGVCRQYDRLLIFTKEDTWMGNISSSSPKRTLEAVTVNPSYGCTSVGAAVVCENSPVCVSDGAIIRWTSETDELNECNQYSISSKIESMLSPSFFENAVVLIDKRQSEIFFADSTDNQGILWIYNYKIDSWYKFDGITVKSMFLHENSLGFIYLNTVYLFNDSICYDELKGGSVRNITATFESYPSDLSVGGNKKRLCGMTLNANLSGGEIHTQYFSEGECISKTLLESDNAFPKSFMRRLNSKRFSYVTLRILSTARAKQRIYSTGIWAKP